MADYKILVPPTRRHRPLLIAVAAVVVVIIAVGAVVVLINRGHSNTAASSSTSTPATVAAPPLTVVSTTPASGATNVASDTTVAVQLSAPIASVATMPALNPPVTGSWKKTGPTVATFTPTAPFLPTTVESLTFPAGPGGPQGTAGGVLATPVTVTFTIGQASTERLQQLLAQANYLPLSFTPSAPLRSPAELFTSQPGTFAWRWPGTPPELMALWTEGSENVITKGAVMNFENQHGLIVDGLAGSKVWSALLADIAAGKTNANPYTYVLVQKTLPQNLNLYNNGALQFAAIPVNTGVPGADTTDGTYPVFEHVTSSRMQGTNPDGSTYDDPAVPWAAYFNGGDALHGFVRGSYGSPQSNGCVEMAIADAAKTWPLTPIGTLVTVTGPAS
ncbi:MAG TPA: L,D-transpeptidase family protein [Acidimicrobiales bacterium]|nr:L,D-transpeptidase family protein [Acidimicrobiales bacterium]